MTDRARLSAAIQKTAWGYILMHVHFNLGTLDILPDWAGYVLILQALPVLAEQVPSAKLLRPLGVVLALWNGVQWLLDLLGAQTDLGGWTVIVTVLGLYFHFQLLTDLASLSEAFGCPETRRILRLRTVRTVLMTAFQLPLVWTWLNSLSATAAEVLALLLGLIQLAVAIWICSVLISLRRSLAAQEPDE